MTTFWKTSLQAGVPLVGTALLVYDWKAVGPAIISYFLFWDWWMNR